MRNLLSVIEDMATPQNTMGMGNPMPATENECGSEPLVGAKKKSKKCKKCKEEEEEITRIGESLGGRIYEAINDEYSYTEQKLHNGEPTKKMMYISGQISGLDRAEAAELFAKASEMWRKKGWLVINPMEHEPSGWSWGAYMRMDIKMLCDCTAIYMMKNYKNSKGALCELAIAEQLGLTIYYE